jgi:hypothetical protein
MCISLKYEKCKEEQKNSGTSYLLSIGLSLFILHKIHGYMKKWYVDRRAAPSGWAGATRRYTFSIVR